jgi:molybdenum-dependent DNA-binding transcriptional regulator ModE
MDTLGFDDLRLFARVAALGTLSAVARERDVPVSQVSRTLTRIEKACGARLIHRSTHGLALTAEGTTFLTYCRSITGTLEELQRPFIAVDAAIALDKDRRCRLGGGHQQLTPAGLITALSGAGFFAAGTPAKVSGRCKRSARSNGAATAKAGPTTSEVGTKATWPLP